ncbi:hypothetical protein A343_2239 [Porphyromonas gingivalis JCVI SC001]|nr:hypothetical protein A343_2239 [Porphyromonas gingivalis JCVI SC001]
MEDLETEKILPKFSGKERGTAPCVKLSLKKRGCREKIDRANGECPLANHALP